MVSGQMAIDRRIAEGQQLPVVAVAAGDPWLLADAWAPLIGAGRCIARAPAAVALPAQGVDVVMTAEQAPEQGYLLQIRVQLPAFGAAWLGDQLEGGAVSFDDSSLNSGWHYRATLQIRTPLAYLERDGDFSPGPLEPPLVGPAEGNLPDGTGFNPYGIWLRKIDYNGLGFDPPPPGQRATGWGPIQIGSDEERNLLSFLKSFRYIVETAESPDQMLSELKELSTSTSENRKMWGRLKRADPLFPDSFFISTLESLPGVGTAIAQKLYQAGFRTVEEVQSASDKELLSVDGIGKGLLKKIRDHEPWPRSSKA